MLAIVINKRFTRTLFFLLIPWWSIGHATRLSNTAVTVEKLAKDMNIKKGDKFKCIKDQIESESAGTFIFKRGKIYKSILDDTITDEHGINRLLGYDYDINRLKEYFIPYISNKRGGYGRKAREML